MRGALYISCSGRGGPHFGARHAEFKMVREALGDIPLIDDPARVRQKSRDFYWYSPLLKEALEDEALDPEEGELV